MAGFEMLEKALQVMGAHPTASEQASIDAITETKGDVDAAVELLKRKEQLLAEPQPPPPADISDPAPRIAPRSVVAPERPVMQTKQPLARTSASSGARASTPAACASTPLARSHNAAVQAASALPYVVHAHRTESKYRLLATVPVCDGKEEDSKLICELEEGTTVDVVEEALSPSGNARVKISDPVWNGWLTRKVAQTGAVLLEPKLVKKPEMVVNGVKLPPKRSDDESQPAGSGDGGNGPSADPAASASEAAKPLTATEKRERDDGRWKAGMLVLLQGLSKMREYNGRSGVLVAWQADRGRYEVRLPTRVVRATPAQLDMHPTQRKREQSTKGDEVVFLTADEQAARDGMYAVKLDPQHWFDQAISRVFDAANEFEVLELPVEWCEDATLIKKQYRKISLSVHPDKNKHPQADAAFRKVYGAFETLSDTAAQRKLLFTLSLGGASEAERERFEQAGAEDDDDSLFQWWWEASVSDVEKAAEEAEGAQYDRFAAAYVSDGLGGSVDHVRWIGVEKAIDLQAKGRAIFIDCREGADYTGGMIPGAFHVPMSAVQYHGIVNTLGQELIHELLSTRRHCLIVVYSNIATPFSRCRAFCRFLLRAGHVTLPAGRFRRLRGGIFGWKHKSGTISRPLTARGMHEGESIEARLRDTTIRVEETVDLE